MIFAERDIAVVFAVASAITDLHQDRARAEGILHEARTNPGVYEVFLVAAAPGAPVYDAFTVARDARN